MNSRSAIWPLAVMFLCASLSCLADEFVYEVASPRFKLIIPGAPQLKMEVHPRNATQPHLRYLGADGDFTVSVFTPTAASGMTPLECAAATVRALTGRPGVPPPADVYKARLNATTFIAAYTVPHGGTVQLHAHLLSAAGGTHCIEVHTTRTMLEEGEIAFWLTTLQKASIEPD